MNKIGERNLESKIWRAKFEEKRDDMVGKVNI